MIKVYLTTNKHFLIFYHFTRNRFVIISRAYHEARYQEPRAVLGCWENDGKGT